MIDFLIENPIEEKNIIHIFFIYIYYKPIINDFIITHHTDNEIGTRIRKSETTGGGVGEQAQDAGTRR